MNLFTANQVNQVYVLKSDSLRIVPLDNDSDVTTSDKLGTIGIGLTPDHKSLYFKYRGPGGVTRSDLIDIDKIERVVATPASAMAQTLMSAKITLNAAALDGSTLVAGQDYMLRITFNGYIGISPEDSQYWKHGLVHATAGMSTSAFYLQLASSIAKNMARETNNLIKVFVTYSTGSTDSETEITATSNVNDSSTFSQTYTGVIIKAVEPDWILGMKQQKQITFTVEPTTIVNNDNDEVVWGDVVYSDKKKLTGGATPSYSVVTSGQPAAAGTVINSKLMADYEYFWHGERGDQYRMMGFPDYVPTTYLVDPSWQYGYDIITIHYSYIGSNESSQKSEKDISIIVPRSSTEDPESSDVGAFTNTMVGIFKSIKEIIDIAHNRDGDNNPGN